jgi:chlorobactene glucosyltransferase
MMLAALGALLILISGLLDIPATRAPEPAHSSTEAPLVAVIVPARNEAHQIAGCLRSLLAQQWPRLRVICVDDCSTDGTYEAARAIDDSRLIVIHGRELEPGWIGKSWAISQGVEHARDASWLLFTDADTIHSPLALPTAIAEAERSQVDLLSLFSRLTLLSFWEKALLPAAYASVFLAFPARRVNDPQSRLAISNGQYILLRRGSYEAIGGHGAVRDRVTEDLWLAKVMKTSGRKIAMRNGRPFVSVRMYASFAEIWWGFAKNAACGMGGPLLTTAGASVLALSATPFLVFPWLLFKLGESQSVIVSMVLACIAIVSTLVNRAWILRAYFGLPPRWALLFPLTQLVIMGIALHSIARQVSGRGSLWKGRQYRQAR